MSKYVDMKGRQPYIAHDTTRAWVESVGRKDNLIKPSMVLRVATDTNHIRNATRTLYNPHPRAGVYTKAIMNNALPGQKVPGVLSWSVSEALQQVTQTATFDCLNALTLSTTTTVVSNVNPSQSVPNDGIGNQAYHADTIAGTWAQDSLFAIERVTGAGGINPNGNENVEWVNDQFGYAFTEANVTYRMFVDQTFQVADASHFPDPAIPDDDDNDVKLDMNWARSTQGAGAYFILVGNEVMKVCQLDRATHTFHVAAGGRAVNGIIETHSPNDQVTLLGHGEPTGEYCAMGYLSIDDFHAESAVLRPGTCLVSYEGYGDIVGPLYHEFDPTKNYQFTGYWFVDTVEPSLGQDGAPKVTVSLKSAGTMYESQKINLDAVQRMKNQFGQWTINGRTLFSAAGATRTIPGDWVDYATWDPTDQFSYPLQIKVEFAQHFAFFQHMQDTQNGLTCIQCHQELADYLKTHPIETARDRPVGRHIYKESIRVLRENAGPIKTYIRLMATMAAAAWDHPAYGTELSQKFTKIPNQLFDNIRNIFTGLCYDGQLDFALATSDPTFDWSTPSYDDKAIISRRKELTCPFQSTYDNAPFSQPMLDLADVNGATFWVTREGYPVFKPYGWNMRPETNGYRHLLANSKPDTSGPRFKYTHQTPGYNGEWFMSYGASISTYSSNTARDQIVTQMWVTANSAFDLDNSGLGFTITASGTGYDDKGNLVFYAPLGGHKQGLALTAGVQQIDTISMDNQYFGLDWNTNPAGWGLVENEAGVDVTMDPVPALYQGSPHANVSQPKGVSNAVRRIQMTVNFFLVRGYMNPIISGSTTIFTLNVNGKFDAITELAVQQLHSVLADPTLGVPGATISGGNFHYQGRSNNTNTYARATYNALIAYFNTHRYAIQTDIWWYVRNGKTWDEYVAAVTGLPVPFIKGHAPKPRTTSNDYNTPLYVIDDKGLQLEIAKWYKTFNQAAVNVGNRKVNQTVDESVTRSISCNLADPRVQPGDTIFVEIPGHLSATGANGSTTPPFNNGIYVTQIQRQLDLEQGSYTATYSGTRHQGVFGKGVTEVVNPKWDFITS